MLLAYIFCHAPATSPNENHDAQKEYQKQDAPPCLKGAVFVGLRYDTKKHKVYILTIIKKGMKLETHEDAFEVHKRAIFTWALEVEGIEKAQRIIGVHASRGIIELLSLFLHKKKLVKPGLQLNHSWFKSEKILHKLPDFNSKQEIVQKMVALENLCEVLTYGKKKPVSETEKAIALFKELEEDIKKIL